VPFERLQLQQDGQAVLMSNVTEDELKGLPAWQEGEGWQAAPRGERILSDMRDTTEQVAQGVATTAENAAEGVATTAQNAAQDVGDAAQDVSNTAEQAVTGTNVQRNALADKTADDLIGQRVVNANGEDLGEIGDIVFDSKNQQAVFAVVDVGGFLGIGEKAVAIPFGHQAVLQASLTEDELKTLPDFDQANYAAFPRGTQIGTQWGGVARQNVADPNAEPADQMATGADLNQPRDADPGRQHGRCCGQPARPDDRGPANRPERPQRQRREHR
jgi:sporulation protein YlmC with PRC-barrel domain